MCRRVTCKRCGKATWAGCGKHIDAALAGVAAADRCQCAKESKGAGSFIRRLLRTRQ